MTASALAFLAVPIATGAASALWSPIWAGRNAGDRARLDHGVAGGSSAPAGLIEGAS